MLPPAYRAAALPICADVNTAFLQSDYPPLEIPYKKLEDLKTIHRITTRKVVKVTASSDVCEGALLAQIVTFEWQVVREIGTAIKVSEQLGISFQYLPDRSVTATYLALCWLRIQERRVLEETQGCFE